MSNKIEKRICWNCDGEVSLNLDRCPYCGVDVSNPAQQPGRIPYEGQEMGSPFQQAPQDQDEDPFHFHPRPSPLAESRVAVSKEEWNESMEEESDEDRSPTSKREMIALLLLLPGVVFLLFGLLLVFFSKEGALTLHWKQSLAFFYFLASLPLIYLGWRAINRD